MKNNRMNNDSRLDVLKKIMRQKLGEIKQDRNSKEIRKNKPQKTKKGIDAYLSDGHSFKCLFSVFLTTIVVVKQEILGFSAGECIRKILQ